MNQISNEDRGNKLVLLNFHYLNEEENSPVIEI